MMNDIAIRRCPPILQSYLIEIIGETVEGQPTAIRRLAAKEVIKLNQIICFPNSRQDLLMAVVEVADLNRRLRDPSAYFFQEIRDETEPYSTDGILFPALVHTVRIEEDLLAYGWLPEQIRALGLAIDSGEEVAWPITREFVTVKDRDGKPRRFYPSS